MPSVTVEYYGISATGRNVTEAKREAAHLLERFVKNHRPRYVKAGDSIAILTPQPQGGLRVEYPLMCGEWRGNNGSCAFTSADMETEVARALLHMTTLADIPVTDACWEQVECKATRRAYQKEALYMFGFYRAHKAAPAELDSNARHVWACEHAREFADSLPE